MGKILISCDMNCTRITEQMYNNLLAKLTKYNGICHVHIYNYIAKKHTYITGKYCEQTHAYTGSHKRVVVDLEQALDTIKLASNDKYDMVYMLTGECESDILYNKLTSINTFCGKISLSPSGVTVSKISTNKITAKANLMLPNNNIISQNYDNKQQFERAALNNNDINEIRLDKNTHIPVIDDIDKSSHINYANKQINSEKTTDKHANNNEKHGGIDTIIEGDIHNTKPTIVDDLSKLAKPENDCTLITQLPPDKLKLVLQYLVDKKSKSNVI